MEHPISNKHLLPSLSEPCASFPSLSLIILLLLSLKLSFYLLDARYLLRHQTYHINRAVIPTFYRYLQAQNANEQIENGKAFLESIIQLIGLFESAEGALKDADSPGLWGALGKDSQRLNIADVMVAPCMFLFFRKSIFLDRFFLLVF